MLWLLVAGLTSIFLAHTAPVPFVLERLAPSRSLWHVDPRVAGRTVYLTYDDGPNPAYTPALLSLLDRFGAKATFFSIGMWAEREPGLLREVHAAGHAIGNHTHTHPRMPFISMSTAREELRRCRAAVEASGG